MTCFGAGDDRGLRRSLDLLPADFALAGTVAEWRRICTGQGEGGPTRVQQVLGTGGATAEAFGDELRLALRRNERSRVLERLMTRLADALYPPRASPGPHRSAPDRRSGDAAERSTHAGGSGGWHGVSCRPSGCPACWPESGCCASRRHRISGTPARPPPASVIWPWSFPEPRTGPWPEVACWRPWPESVIGPSSPSTCRPGWTRRCPSCGSFGAKIPGCSSPT